ncbi:MAG: hypothetical protein IH618_01085 [Ignavibacteriaceae bacterium]|nr:hypothetical protein [Ignavibacteriaceae bacterium]
MIYKIITLSCCLLATMIYNCSSSKQQYEQNYETFIDQYAKVKVEKIDDISFRSINYSWNYNSKNEQTDTVKKSLEEDYPSPFSPSPYFYSWFVIKPDSFEISLQDLNGKIISILLKDYLSEGRYLMKFVDTQINDGIYSVVMNVGNEKFVKKFAYLR